MVYTFQMTNFKTKIFVFFSLLMVFTPQVIAEHASHLYDVEVRVTDESAGARWGAFKKGLDEVFIRISGDSIVMDKLIRPAASAYVKQYSYAPVKKITSNKKGKPLPYKIKIQYNAGAMEKYLLDNGFPVWSKHRADVVIWLAVRDGKHEYVLKQKDHSLLKKATVKALSRRGIPERWPLYDSKDKKILNIADIRGGFTDPIVEASKRYSAGPALTGSIIWNGKQWHSSWNLLMKSEARHWSLVDTSYKRLINKAIDQAADAMGVVFALRGGITNKNLVTIQMDIQAVNSIEKYNQVESYLMALRAVDSTRPLHVDGDKVVFEVTLRSDAADFLNAIKNGDQFIEVEKPKVNNKKTEPLKIPKQKIPEQKKDVEKIGAVKPDEKVSAQLSVKQYDKPHNLIPLYYYKFVN